jgi:hypothetical protein
LKELVNSVLIYAGIDVVLLGDARPPFFSSGSREVFGLINLRI